MDLSSNTIIDDDQYLVLNVFLDRFTGKYTKALKLLILGGPGAGKTFILNLASKLTNGKFTYTAAGGSAASNLRGGLTCCNAFGFTPRGIGRSPQQVMEMEELSESNQPVKLMELNLRFEHKDSTLVIDEVSQIPVLQLAHVLNRVNEIRNDSTSCNIKLQCVVISIVEVLCRKDTELN